MPVKNEIRNAKSYSSIYDMFGGFPMYNDSKFKKNGRSQSVYQYKCGDVNHTAPTDQPRTCFPHNNTGYVTVEQYHVIYKDPSFKSVAKSNSTIFYDLDDVAKQRTCYLGNTKSYQSQKTKKEKLPSRKCRERKSECIVQKCSIDPHKRRTIIPNSVLPTQCINRTRNSRVSLLSSDFCLVDDKERRTPVKYICSKKPSRHQKVWSFAKYHVDYERSGKKSKKKEKRLQGPLEDPCPCQLFSYVCPCGEKNANDNFMEENRKNMVITVDQNTTMNQSVENKVMTDKTENTDINEIKQVSPENVIAQENTAQNNKHTNEKKMNCHRVVCPNCNERVDFQNSIEDEIAPCFDSFLRGTKVPTAAYQCHSPYSVNRYNGEDVCYHIPPCEMIPVCQLPELPGSSRRCAKNPRVVRIAKACRHHPPCIVVPSCQRINVLRNNCEFVPPCMHQPHCINLPLCAPYSKKVNYQSPKSSRYDTPYASPPYLFEGGSAASGLDSYNVSPPSFVHAPTPPTYMMSQKASVFVPTKLPNSFRKCCCCGSSKSCQYDMDCHCSSEFLCKDSNSDAVVFIRDVGCQFRTRSGTSQASNVENRDIPPRSQKANAIGNYFQEVHTLIYEDKFTNPVSSKECTRGLSRSRSFCTIAHLGDKKGAECSLQRPIPNANSKVEARLAAYIHPNSTTANEPSQTYRVECDNNFPGISSHTKRKSRKIFAGKRRRRHQLSEHLFSSSRKRHSTENCVDS